MCVWQELDAAEFANGSGDELEFQECLGKLAGIEVGSTVDAPQRESVLLTDVSTRFGTRTSSRVDSACTNSRS